MMTVNHKYEKMLAGVRAVLFDLDGSLMDSMWMWKKIDIEYLASFGQECSPNLQSDVEGLSIVEVAYYFKNNYGIPDSVEEMIATWDDMAFDKYSHEVNLKPGAMEFLDYCKDKDIKLGICSSNSTKLINAVLDAHKIKDRFGIIITGHDVSCGKPDPECYLTAAKALEVDPSTCLVFEDLVKGIEAGNSAKMRTCAVRDEYSEYQWKEKVETADYYINDYYDIFFLA